MAVSSAGRHIIHQRDKASANRMLRCKPAAMFILGRLGCILSRLDCGLDLLLRGKFGIARGLAFGTGAFL